MITLPYPPKELNPNRKQHWAVKAKAIKSYRRAAGWATRHSKERVNGNGKVYLNVTFYPPDNRRRDRDNMIASFKAGNDGIADALGVNDYQFIVTYEVGAVIKGGEVRVIVTGE